MRFSVDPGEAVAASYTKKIISFRIQYLYLYVIPEILVPAQLNINVRSAYAGNGNPRHYRIIVTHINKLTAEMKMEKLYTSDVQLCTCPFIEGSIRAPS